MRELIIKAKGGDKESLEEIINLFKPLIYKTSISYYIYGYDIEDLKQIATMTVINSIKKVKEDSLEYFSAYVKTAIKNAMANEIEKATNRYYEDKEEKEIISLFEVKDIIDESIDLNKKLLDNELLEIINKIVKNLKNEEQNLIRKLYIENLSLREYAEIEKIKYHKARYLKEKVIDALRKELVRSK